MAVAAFVVSVEPWVWLLAAPSFAVLASAPNYGDLLLVSWKDRQVVVGAAMVFSDPQSRPRLASVDDDNPSTVVAFASTGPGHRAL